MLTPVASRSTLLLKCGAAILALALGGAAWLSLAATKSAPEVTFTNLDGVTVLS